MTAIIPQCPRNHYQLILSASNFHCQARVNQYLHFSLKESARIYYYYYCRFRILLFGFCTCDSLLWWHATSLKRSPKFLGILKSKTTKVKLNTLNPSHTTCSAYTLSSKGYPIPFQQNFPSQSKKSHLQRHPPFFLLPKATTSTNKASLQE